MPELTLEALAARLAAVEKELVELKSGQAAKNGWRSMVGLFDAEPEFMREVIAEGDAIREADRQSRPTGICIGIDGMVKTQCVNSGRTKNLSP